MGPVETRLTEFEEGQRSYLRVPCRTQVEPFPVERPAPRHLPDPVCLLLPSLRPDGWAVPGLVCDPEGEWRSPFSRTDCRCHPTVITPRSMSSFSRRPPRPHSPPRHPPPSSLLPHPDGTIGYFMSLTAPKGGYYGSVSSVASSRTSLLPSVHDSPSVSCLRTVCGGDTLGSETSRRH